MGKILSWTERSEQFEQDYINPRPCICVLHATILNNGSTFACESCGKASTFNGKRNEELSSDPFKRNAYAPRLVQKCTNMTCMEHAAYKLDGKIKKPKGNMAEGGFICAEHNGGCKGHDVVSSLQCYGCFWWLQTKMMLKNLAVNRLNVILVVIEITWRVSMIRHDWSLQTSKIEMETLLVCTFADFANGTRRQRDMVLISHL